MKDYAYEYVISADELNEQQKTNLQKYAGKIMNITLEPHRPVTLSISKEAVNATQLGIYCVGHADYLIDDVQTSELPLCRTTSIHWQRCLRELDREKMYPTRFTSTGLALSAAGWADGALDRFS